MSDKPRAVRFADQPVHPYWPGGERVCIGHRITHPTYGGATVDAVFEDEVDARLDHTYAGTDDVSLPVSAGLTQLGDWTTEDTNR